MRTFYLTETQILYYYAAQCKDSLLCEGKFRLSDIFRASKKALKRGFSIAAIVASFAVIYNLSDDDKKKLESFLGETEEVVSDTFNIHDIWSEPIINVHATVYNAVPGQCNKDVCHTASNRVIDPDNVGKDRIIAMDRRFKSRLGLNWGDVVKIEGAGEGYDGIWVVDDLMGKSIRGKFVEKEERIDFLVPKHIKYGKWDNISLSVLKNKKHTDRIKQENNIPL